MKLRTDIVDLLNQGLSNRAISQQLHCCAKLVADHRDQLHLPKAKSGRKPSTLQQLFDARTELVDGGHRRWTGYHQRNGVPGLRHNGKYYTAHQAAFLLRTGREPVGNALPQCDYEGCVEPTHVDDRLIRERDQAALDAIFNQKAPS